MCCTFSATPAEWPSPFSFLTVLFVMSNYEVKFVLSYKKIPAVGNGISRYILYAKSVDGSLLLEGPKERRFELAAKLSLLGFRLEDLPNVTNGPVANELEAPIASYYEVLKLGLNPMD